ncbi:hypothetical protein JB92DRAFT_2591006, partial [Gautieria morchelliformis]
GNCPCPRCLVIKSQISHVGTRNDQSRRQTQRREDNHQLRHTVARARSFVYDKGCVVNSKAV